MTNAPKPRVVFDTNVLVSALVFGGVPRQITDLIAAKRVRPVMSEAIMVELRRIISVKFPDFVPMVGRYEKLLRHYAIWVPLGSILVNTVPDPDDNAVLETAMAGKCQFVVSGDRDLLDLGSYEGIRIVNPAEFAELAKVS